jgi:hypothetical protein
MEEEILFDSFQVLLFLPAGADTRIGDDARAALDDPPFLDRVRDAVARMLATDPATVALVVRVE